ncbi:hypothetical protein IWZ00DRAFT_67239 [Phyllosticta capitalensis]
MSEPQSYPSPNAAQMAAGAAGLYAHPNGSMSPSQEQSNPVDPHLSLQNDNSLQTTLHDQLAASLSRVNEAPMAGTGQNQQSHVPMAHHHIQQVQPSQPNQRHHDIMGIAQDVMNVARDSHYQPQQDTNLRKRSKVSRACDECRRKKIRCDATSENGPEACTSCKRTGARCQFSRQPQKRGPSKGYIKELADRLSRLEYEAQQQQGQTPQNGHLHQQQAELQSYLQNFNDQGMAGVPDFSNSTGAQATTGRKRTHSMSEGIGEQLRSSLSQTANGTQQQSWDRRESSFGAFEQDSAVDMFQFGNSADVAVGEYYRVIQETYPILPFDQRNLKTRLAECDAKLREGFLAAIDCAVRAWPCTNLSKEANHLDRCYKTYNLLNLEVGVPLNKSSGILLTQSYLLLAIESETQGPTQRDVQTSSLKDMCIASAARVAGNFSLNAMCYRNRPQEIIPDSDDALGRRVFWVAFIMDFFHAISTCSEPSISEERNFLSIEDETLFGTVIFGLARLSKIISHISLLAKFTKDVTGTSSEDAWTPLAPSDYSFKVIQFSINGQLERFHETLPLDPHPLVLLAYWYTRLLIGRYGPATESTELFTCANCITNLLSTHIVFLTPPYHHFAALAALVLGELAEKDDTRDEALRMLGELESALHRTKTDDDAAWDPTIRFYVSKKRASVHTESAAGNSTTLLEHLAEAAVGEREGPGGGAAPTTSPEDSKNGAGAGGALPTSTGENGTASNGNQGDNNASANENGTDNHHQPSATEATTTTDDKKDDIANAAAAAAAAATAAAALNQDLCFNPANMLRDGYLRVLAGVVMPILQQGGHGGGQ